jgi:5'-nucleotidase
MKIKRILLTGDDGYNSIGIRLLVRFLKDKYELNICATKVQQSGVGGMLNIQHGGKWEEGVIDGVKAIYVSGTPGDAMELARVMFSKDFDLVISGINLGPNITGELASGTMTAAVRAIKLHLAKQAIAFSWNAPAAIWYHDHVGTENLKVYADYPGKTAIKLFELAVKNNFWGNLVLNVNFPEQPTVKVKFTRFAYYLDDFFAPLNLDKKTRRYTYPFGIHPHLKGFVNTDADVLRAGYISVTPCQPDILNYDSFQALKGKVINL